MGSFGHAGFFLITVLFQLYVWVLMLRFILHKQRTDYFNPLSQMVIKLTQFVVKPLKKVIKDVAGFEIATVIVILIVQLIKFFLIFALFKVLPNPVLLIVLIIGDTLHQVLNLYFYLLIITAIASWITSSQHNPVLATLNQVTEPLLRPLRKVIPVAGGFDFTPLIALVVIKAIDIALIMPLLRM